MTMRSPTHAFVELSRLEHRLAQIQTPRDAKAEVAYANVIAELARSLGLGLEQQNQIAEHRLRAQRRGGELLKEIDPQPGRPRNGNTATLAAFDLDEHDSRRWQMIAGFPDDVFEGYISSTLAAGDEELTTAGLLSLAVPVAKVPRDVPEPGSLSLEGPPLLRFSQADLPTPTIVALILRVLFPDAVTALDTTYGLGGFWDGSAHVRVTGQDRNAERAPHGIADFTNLPYADESHDVVLFDPPHLSDGGDDGIMATRYGTIAGEDIETVVCAGTREAWRVARLGVVIKVADHVHGQRFVRMTGWVCGELGEPYDVVHQIRSGALVDPKWEEQLSAYNNGATYLIFRKGNQRHTRR